MKKIVLFLFLPILFFSCNKENKTEAVDVASGKKEYIYSPDISANENQLVIVRFSSGKKNWQMAQSKMYWNSNKTLLDLAS